MDVKQCEKCGRWTPTYMGWYFPYDLKEYKYVCDKCYKEAKERRSPT